MCLPAHTWDVDTVQYKVVINCRGMATLTCFADVGFAFGGALSAIWLAACWRGLRLVGELLWCRQVAAPVLGSLVCGAFFCWILLVLAISSLVEALRVFVSCVCAGVRSAEPVLRGCLQQVGGVPDRSEALRVFVSHVCAGAWSAEPVLRGCLQQVGGALDRSWL